MSPSSTQPMKDSTMAENPEALFIPPWLKPLLNATYFLHCEKHGESTRCECNFFCLTCKGKPLCYCCLLQHEKHPTIQIRRSSYNDVVRLDEISQYIDASNIQTYRINNARIIFLNERPIIRPGRGGGFACDICRRNLIDPFKFCSLGCKLEAVKRCQPEVTFVLSGEVPKVGRKRLLSRWIAERALAEGDKEPNPSVENQNAKALETPPCEPSRPRHRRKGIPHRAPFF